MPPERIDRLPQQEGKESLRDQKFSFVFPGQGSQVVGMGIELFEASTRVKRVFEEADDTLGLNLSGLIFKGPKEDLQNTINTQPALVTVSFAFHEALKERLGDEPPTPEFLAGNSAGTITASVVAKAITFRDGVKLARERGMLMEQASKEHPGAMAAIIGLDEFALEHVCAETGVEIGNINSEDQITITGDELAVVQAMDLAFLRGARNAIRLPVSGAFHSYLMASVQPALKEAISGIYFKDPTIPILSNSEARPLTTARQIKTELVAGVCKPVLWKAGVEYIRNAGVTTFVEIGPGRVLTGLAKSINPNLNAVAINSLKSLNEFAAKLSQQPPNRNNPLTI